MTASDNKGFAAMLLLTLNHVRGNVRTRAQVALGRLLHLGRLTYRKQTLLRSERGQQRATSGRPNAQPAARRHRAMTREVHSLKALRPLPSGDRAPTFLAYSQFKLELVLLCLPDRIVAFLAKPDRRIDRSLRPVQEFEGFTAEGLGHDDRSHLGGSTNHLSGTDATDEPSAGDP